jgi:hypothetical protein
MTLIRRHLGSPAMIVACVSLVVALGGVSYAAGVLPENSVGTAQLKKKAVTRAKLKRNAVTSAKVKNGSLRAADFKAGQLPQGERGAQGPAGPQGPKGDTGDPGVAKLTVMNRQGPWTNVPAGATANAQGQCQPGEVATGGGPVGLKAGMFILSSNAAEVPEPITWRVTVHNTTAAAASFSVEVVCAKAS